MDDNARNSQSDLPLIFQVDGKLMSILNKIAQQYGLTVEELVVVIFEEYLNRQLGTKDKGLPVTVWLKDKLEADLRLLSFHLGIGVLELLMMGIMDIIKDNKDILMSDEIQDEGGEDELF